MLYLIKINHLLRVLVFLYIQIPKKFKLTAMEPFFMIVFILIPYGWMKLYDIKILGHV